MVAANRSRNRWEKRLESCIVLVAITVALCVARPYAGSWNDGSRLASVESLIDHHTWAIDQSVFVQPRLTNNLNTPLPYASGDAGLNTHGTFDKLYIAGHYYSDKSPVPALLMAGCYRVWQCVTGWTARLHVDHFCRAMTWVSSGLAYLVAVWCIYRMNARLGLPLPLQLLLTGSFAFGTVALPYAQHVNNHILLLAVTAALVLEVANLRTVANDRRKLGTACVRLGLLAGLGYTIDLGAGPVLFVSTGLFIFISVVSQSLTLALQPRGLDDPSASAPSYFPCEIDFPRVGRSFFFRSPCELVICADRRCDFPSVCSETGDTPTTTGMSGQITPISDERCKAHSLVRMRSVRVMRAFVPLLCFVGAALPWLLLHHALNYAIGGTFQPANANPEYFRWPGSPFAAGNLTGSWIHQDFGSFLLYAASMLVGKRGFLGHNLPLFLTVPAIVLLLRRHPELRREVAWALGCCAGTWLLYAATSNNSSGQCCTIRWFVPLLAPGFYVIALFLQRYPSYRLAFVLLSGWGFVLVVLMRDGPWMNHMVAFFWPIQAAALLSWGLCFCYRRCLSFS